MEKLKINLYVNLSIVTYIFNAVKIKKLQVLFLDWNKQIDSKNQMEEQILKNQRNNYGKKNKKGGICPAIYHGTS